MVTFTATIGDVYCDGDVLTYMYTYGIMPVEVLKDDSEGKRSRQRT